MKQATMDSKKRQENQGFPTNPLKTSWGRSSVGQNAPLSRRGQMEREGIGRHLEEPDGIREHNNKVNDLSHAGA